MKENRGGGEVKEQSGRKQMRTYSGSYSIGLNQLWTEHPGGDWLHLRSKTLFVK